MENVADTQSGRNYAGIRRSGIVTTSSNLHGHEFREILDTAFQAQSDMPIRAAEILG
jgi:hypothetical protein